MEVLNDEEKNRTLELIYNIIQTEVIDKSNGDPVEFLRNLKVLDTEINDKSNAINEAVEKITENGKKIFNIEDLLSDACPRDDQLKFLLYKMKEIGRYLGSTNCDAINLTDAQLEEIGISRDFLPVD